MIFLLYTFSLPVSVFISVMYLQAGLIDSLIKSWLEARSSFSCPHSCRSKFCPFNSFLMMALSSNKMYALKHTLLNSIAMQHLTFLPPMEHEAPSPERYSARCVSSKFPIEITFTWQCKFAQQPIEAFNLVSQPDVIFVTSITSSDSVIFLQLVKIPFVKFQM